MTGSQFFTIFCCMLVMGTAVLTGCTQMKDKVLPGPAMTVSHVTGTTPPAKPAYGGTSTGEPADLSCNLSLTGTPVESPDFASHFTATGLLTRPTDRSITISIVPKEDLGFFVAYGTTPGSYPCRTPTGAATAGAPFSRTITGLWPDTQYYYRTCVEASGIDDSRCGPESTFFTRREPGSTFTFGVQGDSHPERGKTMFDPALYRQTLQNVRNDGPDFYILMGDDFSIDHLIGKNQLSRQAVENVYLAQRTYLDTAGSSSPVFLVNGNHEQAARYMLDGTPDTAAVYAGSARMQFFPQPVPGGFYTGDDEPVEYVGLAGDYYAWTWGDALFVVIDPYWHSPVPVDNVAGKNAHQKKDLWDITLGDAQYAWLKKTLSESNARYKFVFAHHVLGTGRGGIEEAGLYEWGGKNPKGIMEFTARRPGWELPIHQLMAKNGVTVFFQGHDHLFARQELDGVIYQEVPVPADPTYSTFNADAYTSGDSLPNTGYLRVTVSPENATVEYVKTYLPGRETAGERNGMVAYTYSVAGKTTGGGA